MLEEDAGRLEPDDFPEEGGFSFLLVGFGSANDVSLVRFEDLALGGVLSCLVAGGAGGDLRDSIAFDGSCLRESECLDVVGGFS